MIFYLEDSKFSLNLLTANQVDIAEICSGAEEGQIRFNHPDWEFSEKFHFYKVRNQIYFVHVKNNSFVFSFFSDWRSRRSYLIQER